MEKAELVSMRSSPPGQIKMLRRTPHL